MHIPRFRGFHHLHLLAIAAAAGMLATLTPIDALACTDTIVAGQSNSSNATVGHTCANNYAGVYGEDDSSSGGYGVEGLSTNLNGYGVYGSNLGGGRAIHGVSTSGNGTALFGEGANYGVYATAANSGGTGVHGEGATGVSGVSTGTLTGYGVWGGDGGKTGTSGVTGSSTGTNSFGVEGIATGSGSYGVYGVQFGSASYAGYFSGAVKVTGALTVGSCSGCGSDIRLKKNVKPLDSAIDQLLKLHGVTFEWKNPGEHENDSGTQRGFIAQDVQKIFPNWVKDDGYTAPDGQTYKTIELRQIEALEVESIRTLKAENDDLQKRLEALESGRRPIASGLGLNGASLAVGGLAIAGAFFVSRRRRADR